MGAHSGRTREKVREVGERSHTYGQQNDGPGRKVRSAKSCKTPPHAATWVKSLSFTGGDAPKLTRYSGDRGKLFNGRKRLGNKSEGRQQLPQQGQHSKQNGTQDGVNTHSWIVESECIGSYPPPHPPQQDTQESRASTHTQLNTKLN